MRYEAYKTSSLDLPFGTLRKTPSIQTLLLHRHPISTMSTQNGHTPPRKGKYDFSNKVAIVTGSSSGIGEAIAIQFATYGAKLTLTAYDPKGPANLERVAEECERVSPGGLKPVTVFGDITQEPVVQTIIERTVEKYGRINILVNNAGAGMNSNFDDAQQMIDSFDFTFSLNVRSIVRLTSLAVPHLEKTQGVIVNMASMAAIKPVSFERTIFHYELVLT